MSESSSTAPVPELRDPSAKRKSWWWWKIAFPVGLLLACVDVAVVWLLFEPKYEASALLEINEQAPYVAFEPKESVVSKGYFHSQMEIIRSRWIIGRAVETLEFGKKRRLHAASEEVGPRSDIGTKEVVEAGKKANRLPEIFKWPDPID